MPTNSTTPPTSQVLLGCTKCGAHLPAEAQFCLKCGKPVSLPPKTSTVIEVNPPKLPQPPRKRRLLLWLLFVLFLAVAVWAITSDSPFAQQAQELAGWKHDQTILDSPFTVGPHTFRYYKFALPEGSVNVAVVGQFTSVAEGHVVGLRKNDKNSKDKDKDAGTDNNIEVYVLTDTAFTVWQNGYETNSLYESDKVAEGTVQADIPAGAGIYYLVFSNKASIKTPKSVHATVLLRYKSWLPEWFRRMKDRFSSWVGP